MASQLTTKLETHTQRAQTDPSLESQLVKELETRGTIPTEEFQPTKPITVSGLIESFRSRFSGEIKDFGAKTIQEGKESESQVDASKIKSAEEAFLNSYHKIRDLRNQLRNNIVPLTRKVANIREL